MKKKQIAEKIYSEQYECDKKIRKAKFCIISNYGYLFLRNSLINFTLDSI